MAHFLSGCDYKKFFFMLLVTASFFLTTVEQRAAAQCDPGWWGGWIGGGCGGHWYKVSSESSIIDRPALSITNSIGGCNAPGEVPPTGVECRLSTTSETVTNWQMAGSLTIDICSKVGINIGGALGSTSSVTIAGGVGATLTHFCQTCEAENGTRFKSTSYKIRCSCGSNRLVSGHITEYITTYIKGSTGRQPNPPCNPICPSGE